MARESSTNARINVYIAGEVAGASIKKLKEESKLLKKELEQIANPKSEEWKKKAAEIQKVESRVKELNREVKGTGTAFRDVQNQTSGFGNHFKALFTFDVIKQATNYLVEFGKTALHEFREAEVNAHKLEFAVKNIANGNSGALDKLLQQAGELQESGGIFSDDDIMKAQTMLVQFGLTTDQTEALIPKILDLASAQGIDLASATDKVISGINGQTKGLKDAGIQFADTGSKTENLGILMDKLGKFTGSATAELETSAGAAKQLDNRFNEIMETIGSVVDKGIKDLKGALVDFWDFMNGSFDPQKSSTYKKLQGAVESNTTTFLKNISSQLEGGTLSATQAGQKLIDAYNGFMKKSYETQNLEDKKFYVRQAQLIFKHHQEIFSASKTNNTKIVDDATLKGEKMLEKLADAKKFKEQLALMLKDFETFDQKMVDHIDSKTKDDEKPLIGVELPEIGGPQDAAWEKLITDAERYAIALGFTKDEFEAMSVAQQILAGGAGQTFSDLGTALTDLSMIAEDSMGKNNEFTRAAIKLGQAQAAVQQVLALQMALAGMAAQLKMGFPANIVAVAGTLAAFTGAAASIKKLVTPVAFAEGGSTFSKGGNVNQPIVAMAGEKGPEWIAPNWMLHHPSSANIIGALEQMRVSKMFGAGGGTANAKSTGNNNGDLVGAINTLNAILERGINAKMNYSHLTKELEKMDTIKNNSKFS